MDSAKNDVFCQNANFETYSVSKLLCSSVKVDTKRVAFELSPAALYDGPEGFYRVRMARRWVDTADGKPHFFDKAGLAALVVEVALGTLPKPSPAPDIPCPSRVSVRLWRTDMPYYEGTWTNTPPILDHTGHWVVNVSLSGKRVFVPIEDVIFLGGCRRG